MDDDLSTHIQYTRTCASVKDKECRHQLWQKRCSICGTVLESDTQYNFTPGIRAKVIYSELSQIVCSYRLSIRLQKELPAYPTRLVWVEALESGIVTLRIRQRIKKAKSRIVPAYTSSDLCGIIHTEQLDVDSDILCTLIGRLASEPNKLAKALLAEFKNATT